MSVPRVVQQIQLSLMGYLKDGIDEGLFNEEPFDTDEARIKRARQIARSKAPTNRSEETEQSRAARIAQARAVIHERSEQRFSRLEWCGSRTG